MGLLVARDSASMKRIMDPTIDFKAVTPGGFWESTDADVVVDDIVVGAWFPPDRAILGLDVFETEEVAGLERIRYRLEVASHNGRFTVEQQGYVEGAERISAMRLVCSGYRRS